jgi:hypothetical protein
MVAQGQAADAHALVVCWEYLHEMLAVGGASHIQHIEA